MRYGLWMVFLLHANLAKSQCRPFVYRFLTNPVIEKVCFSSLLEDAKELYEKIQEVHPDLYRNTTKEALDSSYLRLINTCTEDLTLLSFVAAVNAFLQTIKDSHTFINLRDLLHYKALSRYYLPLQLTESEGKLWVVKSGAKAIPAGVNLLSVNAVPVKMYQEQAPVLTPKESLADSAFRLMQLHVVSALMNLNHSNRMNTYQWVDGKDTVTAQVKIPRFIKAQHKEAFKWGSNDITFEAIEGSGILKIASFSPTNIKGFKKKLDQIFQEISVRPIDKLILDLRFNTGGYILLQEYLMSFLAPKNTAYSADYVYKRSAYDRFSQLSRFQRKRFIRAAKDVYPNGALSKEWDFYNKPYGSVETVTNNPILKNNLGLEYSGPCMLLVNELSMSAAANFTSWFIKGQRGEVIGSPVSGTNAGTFANPATLFLTNTGLPISVSTMKINLLSEGEIERALRPNHEIRPTLQELKQGVDGMLHFALNH